MFSLLAGLCVCARICLFICVRWGCCMRRIGSCNMQIFLRRRRRRKKKKKKKAMYVYVKGDGWNQGLREIHYHIRNFTTLIKCLGDPWNLRKPLQRFHKIANHKKGCMLKWYSQVILQTWRTKWLLWWAVTNYIRDNTK